MNRLLDSLLARSITTGRLEIVDSSGQIHGYGEGDAPVRVRFASAEAERAVLLDPDFQLGEQYMDGGFVMEAGDVRDLLTLLRANVGRSGRSWWTGPVKALRGAIGLIGRNNTAARARDNVRRHYDLDGRLYDLFLDEDRQYSCAYFEDGVTDLEEAQRAKKRHIAGKLGLRPGQRVLDIGSGWGGLGFYLAEAYDVDVTGVTLSEEQHKRSNERAAERGLTDRVRFELRDYRDLDTTFDRVVSVGMFEHVGRDNYDEFFARLASLMADDGIAVIHTIARKDNAGPINPWIRRHIFPGAYIPDPSELAPVIERNDFWLTDLENWRLHYARTLAAWDDRFQARRADAAAFYDERFCRMWEFYLQFCEFGFEMEGMCVFQIQLAKQIDAVPLTRDYMYRVNSG